MVLFKRKPVQYVAKSPILEDQEVWTIEATDEVFVNYEDYLQRMDFYKQKRFICEITGHSGLSFFDALKVEMEASDEVDDAFPDALREPILRKVQFSTISRIDNLVDHVFEEFKLDFYPGESVTVMLDDGDRLNGQIREKTKFPELVAPNGAIERKAFARYFVRLTNRPDEEALVDQEHIVRDRKTFTKQRLRSFIKNTVTREPWTGAPWLVKTKIAKQYRINSEIPNHLKHDNQILQRRSHLSTKKSEYDGNILNFYAPPGRLPELKPKGSKIKIVQHDPARSKQEQFKEYQSALTGNNTFKVQQTTRPNQFTQFGGEHLILPATNGYSAIAAKAQPKPPPPPPPKYPIEDLEIPPARDGNHRPLLKYLSQDTPTIEQVSDGAGSGILMESVGPLLETWDTLNVYCEVYQLDSFTFDDYLEALQFSSDEVQCELLVEIHCAVFKKLVNDVNDKNGQVQVSLPELAASESQRGSKASSLRPTPTPEPEVKRTTRSSFAKSEAAELIASEKAKQLSPIDANLHRAAGIDQSARGYDWKMRVRKRDFGDGKWVVILVGLLNQLSGNPRLRKACDEVLVHLAPMDEEATPATAIARYGSLDINLRVKALQILCMLSLETKAIRAYMEECNVLMTDHRKEKIEVQRNRKAAVEELRVLHEERKVLQPDNASASPQPELEELSNSKINVENEEDGDQEVVVDTEDEEPHQGRSLRRANDRALQRKKRQEEEKERKLKAIADKAKKPTKQAKQFEKVLKKIEAVKVRIREYEEEILTIENDLREADCPRTRVLGKDRFWNRYYWMERNAMPYAGLPTSSTANAGYANGCIWVQGPDDIERQGFIELSDAENMQYRRAFNMGVPERKMLEEGSTHVFSARQWGYYDDPDQLDKLIGWLDPRGVREIKLRKELQAQREKISVHMVKRKEYLTSNDDKKSETGEPLTRVSTRTKTYIDPTGHRCLMWKNLTAIEENGHLHSEPKPPSYKKQSAKAAKKAAEEEARQTRATNRGGKPLTRQGTRYDF